MNALYFSSNMPVTRQQLRHPDRKVYYTPSSNDINKANAVICFEDIKYNHAPTASYPSLREPIDLRALKRRVLNLNEPGDKYTMQVTIVDPKHVYEYFEKLRAARKL